MIRTFAALTVVAGVLTGCGPKPEPASSTRSSASSPPAATDASPSPERVKALLAELPAPFAAGDVTAGHAVFARCQVCHTVAEGGPNVIGPNLWGVFGRKVATKADFTYSDALKSKAFTWDAAHLDAWLENPRTVAPGTKMSFIGLSDPKQRIDVIAYLKVATSK